MPTVTLTAHKTLAYNRQEAEALAGQSAAKSGGQVGKQILEEARR
jgi:hypothetical protein